MYDQISDTEKVSCVFDTVSLNGTLMIYLEHIHFFCFSR